MPNGRHLPGGQPGAAAGLAAVELRVSGASFADVANVLGLSSPREALQLVERELASHVDHDQVDVLRAEASARLERLLESTWPKAMDSSDSEHLGAVRVALAILDRHIRLHGADRPTQLEVYTPTAAELERFVAGIVEGTISDVEEADVVGELGTGELP